MQYAPTTRAVDPVQQASRLAVLLIFFVPPTLTNRPERASLMVLANTLQVQLGGLVRVLHIDGENQSDVVRSFAITQMPAFILVRRGVELWRQEGAWEEAALIQQIQGLLV